MSRTSMLLLYAVLAPVALAAEPVPRQAAPAPNPAPAEIIADVRKTVIETPTKDVLAKLAAAAKAPNPAPINNIADRGKGTIEVPTKEVLAKLAAAVNANAFVNPKVEPGKVKWHADFAAACEAAKKSAKPVLLFQMMGKLDDQFC